MFGIIFKTKEEGKRNLHEIARDSRVHLIRLKQRNFVEYVSEMYYEHRARFMTRMSFFLLIIIIFSYSFFAKADVAKLYSSSCLGDWQKPELAVGEPTVGSRDSEFTEDNSALLNVAAGRVYCGNFKGDLPTGVEITRVDMHLNVSFT